MQSDSELTLALMRTVNSFARNSWTHWTILSLFLAGCATEKTVTTNPNNDFATKWEQFERTFQSSVAYKNPVQEASLRVSLVSPSGEKSIIEGFWDGERTWKFRFSPNQIGKWTYETSCSDSSNVGLHSQAGSFVCIPARGNNRFALHGSVRVSPDRHYLMHEDGTPFFWLGDTAWNGPLLSRPEDWILYLRERQRQEFTAVQWVATQWRASPDGNRLKEKAFTGEQRIAINPAFFQRLDEKIMDLNLSGFLSAPVMLWAIGGGSNPKLNPGFSLPEDQAILLARYMVARWGASQVIWILAGDGDYRGEKAERWKRIGRAVFGESQHAPVMLHPGGMHWNLDEFQTEKWLDILGYQSGHGDDDKTLQWIFNGPPATDWKKEPYRPFINLEPPYENHVAYQSKARISPATVRRAIYWSLLVAPTAGVTYGGHGVWGWDDGTKPPTDHPNTGIPQPWQLALNMPAAEQMKYLAEFFNSIDFWRLHPAPQMIVNQPGGESAGKHIAASRTDEGDLAVIYVPDAKTVAVRVDALPKAPQVSWFNPRNGERSSAVGVVSDNTVEFVTPGEGDWVMLVKAGTKSR
jgi:hypothetical protein